MRVAARVGTLPMAAVLRVLEERLPGAELRAALRTVSPREEYLSSARLYNALMTDCSRNGEVSLHTPP